MLDPARAAVWLICSLLACVMAIMPGRAYSGEEKEKINFVVSSDGPILTDRLVYAVMKALGYESVVDSAPMSYALQMADSGERDGIASQVEGIEKFFPNLTIVPESVSTVSFHAIARRDSNIKITKWKDLAGLRVGNLFRKNYINNHLPGNIKDHLQKETSYELDQALKNNECDVLVVSRAFEGEFSAFVVPEHARHAGIIDSRPTFFFLGKKHAHLAPKAAEVIREIKRNGTYERLLAGGPLHRRKEKQVLHISSYYPDDPWEQRLKYGIESVLSRRDDILYYNVPLYSNRFLTDQERARSAYFSLRSMLLNSPPDVVIVSDNNALKFVCSYYRVLFNKIPVILCGVNGMPEQLWQLGKNYTGVWETVSADEVVEQILKLRSETKNIFVINDHSQTGLGVKEQIQRQLRPYAGKLNIQYNGDVHTEQLLEDIKALPEGSAILLGYYEHGLENLYYSQADLQKMLTKAAPGIPRFGLFDFSSCGGQIGGKYVLPEPQGEIAAQMALRTLDGTPVDKIFQVHDTKNHNVWKFDLALMEALSLDEKLLPAQALLTGKKPSLYELNPQAFILVIILFVLAAAIMLVLVGVTFMMRNKNKRLLEIQKNLHSAEELLLKDAEIIAAKERLDIALSSSLSGVWEISFSDKMFSFDKTAAGLLGIKSSFPMPLARLTAHLEEKNGSGPGYEYFDRLNRGELAEIGAGGELKITPENEPAHYLDIYAKTASGSKSSPVRIIGMVMDVTNRVKMTEELHKAKEMADLASQAKSRFLSNMSHEIRTPINAIMGMIKIAKKSDELHKIKVCLDKADISSGHLLSIINDILDLSKVESGNIELFEEDFLTEKALTDIINVAGVNAAEKNQEILVFIHKEMPGRLHGDIMRISQVILNLLSNAVKFSDHGSDIRLEIRCKKLPDKKLRIECDVIDHGIGMTSEQIGRLFHAFQQAESGITKRYGGTGLGLAISKKIANLMGGDINVSSVPGEGSRFFFHAILKECEPGAAAPEVGNARNLYILVIDDNAAALSLTGEMLNDLGIGHELADSLELAENLLASNVRRGSTFNLILLDSAMEGVEFKEIMKIIRAVDTSVPVICLVPLAEIDKIGTFSEEAGTDVVIVKPVLPFSLAAALNEHQTGQKIDSPSLRETLIQQFPGKHILVVEDIDINREIISGMLEPSLVEISEAENGLEAVDLFEKYPGRFDLVFMDIQMPVMDGYTATRLIRGSSHPRGGSIPIVAMTANAFREDVERALSAGMNGHISKPVDADILYKAMNKHLYSDSG